MRIPLVCSVVMAIFSLSAHADTSHWTATSTASLAVTGNISIHPDRIVFSNSAEIRIRPVSANHPGVYRVDPPANPILANGNRLCSEERAPTFVVLARSDGAASLAESPSMFLKVFDGPDEPAAWTAAGMLGGGPGLCAILNYERAASAPPTTRSASFDRHSTAQAQAMLNELGYDAGPIDGALGPRTRGALLDFQIRTGLPRSGAPDTDTLAALEELQQLSRAASRSINFVRMSPEETVREVYTTLGLAPAEQRQHMAVMRAPDQRARYFTPALVAFFDEHDRLGGDLTYACIDFSLEVDGQDYDEAEIARTLSVRSLMSGNHAVVDATFTSFGTPNHYRYEFTQDDEGWKIADIASLQGGWRLSAISCP